MVKLFRLVDKYEQDLVTAWWLTRKQVAPALDLRSDFGFMFYDSKSTAQMAVFVYPMLGCQMALQEFLIANPDNSKEQRDVAWEELQKFINDFLFSFNYKYITSFTNSKGFQERLLKDNYRVGEKLANQYFREVQCE